MLGDAPEDLRLRHRRYEAVADGFRPGEPCEDRVAGAIAYGGPLIAHFGHMVAEAVHRVVPARRLFGADRFLFVNALGDASLSAFERFPPWMRSLLGFLELDQSNCHVADRNTTVEALQIVEQGDRLGEHVAPEYLDMLADYSAARLRRLHDEALPSDKVYVSRSVVGRAGGAFLGEAYLEAALREAGFWVFRPEEHPYSFQAHVYNRAAFLLFAEGSAVHGASLLGRAMMNRAAVLMRRPGVARQMRRVLAGRCAEAQMGFCSTFLGTVVGNPALGNRPAWDRGVSVYGFDALLQFLEGQGFYLYHLFDRRAYFEACERELLDYLRFFLDSGAPQWPRLGTAHFAQLLSAFENAKASEVN